MGEVKPWEPVNFRFAPKEDENIENPITYEWDDSDWYDIAVAGRAKAVCPLDVTLANKQKIIVRALSEERKAARSARQEANR